MKKKLVLICSLLFILPFVAKADGEPNVSDLGTYLEGNIILFSGETINSSHAVMCKLLDDQDEEIDMLSVEVNNEGTDGTFNGRFMAPETGNYTVTCANYEGGTIVTADVTVEEMTQLTVEFDTNGGSAIAPVNVNAGQAITRPADPEKDGKVFAGWYEDDTLTTPFSFSTRITGFITIYAKWVDAPAADTAQVQVIFFGEGGTYQVDFEANDSINPEPLGEPVNSSHRYFVEDGKEVTLTAIPAQGYHFDGWYNTHETEDQGQMVWVLDERVSTSATYVFTPEDYVNLQPVFAADTPGMVTVTFNTNGGSNINPIEVQAGQTISAPTPSPTNGDKIFAGWCSDSTLSTPFDFATPITENTIIYAKWEDPVPEREVLQFQVWHTDGGSTAIQYTIDEPNPHNLQSRLDLDFEPVVGTIYYGIEATVTAKANNGYTFAGWKHVDIEYEKDSVDHPNICVGDFIATSTSYKYKPGVTVLPGDEEELRYICAVFEKEYTVTDPNGNEISFSEEEGHTYTLSIMDLSNLTDEQLAEMDPPMDRETYEEVKNSIIDATKPYGTLISFLEIDVIDEHNNLIEQGPFTIRLKLTDEMKKYNTFKLINVRDDMSLGEVITLEVEGDHLVGTLPHLSAYVLAGSYTEKTTDATTTKNNEKAPKTYDGIMTWVIALGISIIGLTALFVINKKSKKKSN